MNEPRALLFVKLSALGDQLFALPAIEDAIARWPNLRIDWVVDERFADIPRMHPHVRHVHAVPLRRWRRAIGHMATWREAAALVRAVRSCEYDLVVDGQGMWKSFAMARLARARERVVHHPDDCGEPSVVRGYDRIAPAFPHLHGTHRLRALMAFAVGSNMHTPLRYGLSVPAAPRGDAYAMLLHGASKPEKCWPPSHWIAVGHALVERGITPLLPWGNDDEHRRAHDLARAIPHAEVLPRLSIPECAALLAHARVAIGLDTGLTHLAAAYGTPCVALFLATRLDFFAPVNPARSRALGGPSMSVSVEQTIVALDRVLASSNTQ
ncbi:MAG TPA: lipopolysaccharide heptosyltransferase I [Burkholderiaceae bacterium]|nr:lipopolysaccharide heptosyltransferase I [Burkholderiaceae bacterium]